MQGIVLELVRESLIAAVNEMRANMIHASYSSVIFEGHDFSCVLLTRDGRQIAQGLADHPIHIFATPSSAREVMRQFEGDVTPGDTFLHNDPYTGGTHLNDILMLHPIFDGGQLVGFAAIRAHWNDVGGMTPGSLSGRVSEILQEGIRIPPIKIASRGVLNEAAMRLMFSNMRVESERRGDFHCMLGTCRKAEEHLQRLCRRFGRNELLDAMNELIKRAGDRMRAAISKLPAGTYRAETFIDNDGHSPEPLRVRLALTIAGDSLTADFTGTAEQVAGPTNAGGAMAANAVLTVTKTFLDPLTAINEGSFEPIAVKIPPGTIASARPPAPCGGMGEVKYAMDSAVAAALGQALPSMQSGEIKGTANHTHIAVLREGSDPKILYEWPAAGTGGTARRDGSNVLRTYSDGDFNSIHAIEVIEATYPLRVVRSGIRPGSCGDGALRGGFGLLREIEVRGEQGLLSVLSDRNVLPPAGVRGGRPGAPNRFLVRRGEEWLEPSAIPGKISGFQLRRGDVVSVRTSGGGGWGDPLERDPARVEADVVQGYLDRDQARQRYGVILDDSGIDETRTTELRACMRAEVQHIRLTIDSAVDRLKGARSAKVSPDLAARHQLADRSVVEIFAGDSPICRAWVTVAADLEADEVRVGRTFSELLGPAAQGPVTLRPLVVLPN